ncbi:MAG: 5-formyltetrahydrofolate cyclo-ligase [Flavobacteriaceae bacterium]
MDKASLRKLYRQMRNDLPPSQIRTLQKQLELQFSSFNLSSISVIHVFLPIAKQTEVNTWPLIESLWAVNKTVIASTTDFDTKVMRHWRIEANTSYHNNNYGIPEPITQDEVFSDQINMVLVPLLSFDTYGHRVGYGQGFYDRFLASCRDDCRFVGLSYFEVGPKIEGLSEHDIRLDQCITPKEVYNF